MSQKNPRRPLIELEIMTILNSRVGGENGLTRAELLEELHRRGFSEFDASLVNLSDRDMRKVLESIRIHEADGAFVIAVKRGKQWVYCRAKDREEFKRALSPEWSRGITVINRVRLQTKRAYPELMGQFEIPEGGQVDG